MMLRTIMIVVLMLAANPTWAGCPPKDYNAPPKVIGLPYPAARASLIGARFQPLLDWERMQHDYGLAAEAWIAETSYFEVQACSNMGAGECRAHFVDDHRNLFRIMTKDSETGPMVADAFFVCGREAAKIFWPRDGQ
jgi:hypothetical protein